MADIVRLKRRAAGGAAGAPSSLTAAEVAFNEQDNTLYYGKGNSGGAATSIIPIAGPGAFLPVQPETTALLASMTIQPTTARAQLIDYTIAQLKAKGLWTQLDTLYFLAGADNQCTRLNWKNPGTLTLTVTNAPVFTVDQGWAGDGVSASLVATGYNPSTFGGNYTQNASCGGVFMRDRGTSLGITFYLNTLTRITAFASPQQTVQVTINDATVGSMAYSLTSPFVPSHFTVRRSGATARQLLRDGVVVFSDATASTAMPTAMTLLGATNFGNQQLSIAYTGGALSDTDVANLTVIINNYLQNIGAIKTLSVPSGLQPETLTLLNAMTTLPNENRILLIDNMISQLKLRGIWAQLDALWVMASHDQPSSVLNWKAPGISTLIVTAGVPVFTVDQGWAGDGTAGYLTANAHNPSTYPNGQFTLNAAATGVFARTIGSSPGNLTVGSGRIQSLAGFANIQWGGINDATVVSATGVIPSPYTPQLWTIRRTSTPARNLIRGATTVASDAIVATTISTSLAFLGITSFTNAQLSLAFIGGALSDTDLGNFNTIITNYLQGVGAIAGQLQGTATNDSANPGNVGEYISSAITTNVPLTTTVAANVGSISLTPGDWDVDGWVQFTPSAAPTVLACGLNTTSATMPSATGGLSLQQLALAFTSAAVQVLYTGDARISVSAATTVYLVASATFASGTLNTQGYISARRRR